MADLYETLGVSRDATADEIKRAYRKLARELHPDINPDPAVQDRFKEVTAAYDVLSDDSKRRQYDMGGNPFGGSAGGFNGGFGFDDIMSAFFGQGAQSRGPRIHGQRNRAQAWHQPSDRRHLLGPGSDQIWPAQPHGAGGQVPRRAGEHQPRAAQRGESDATR